MTEAVRIDFSARIGCGGLEFLLTQFHRGDDPILVIQTKIAEWGQANTFLHGGYDYSAGQRKPGAWNYSDEPSEFLDYAGPLLFESPIEAKTAKFCGECGQARVNGGAFCISCGHKFRDSEGLVGDLFDEFVRIKDSGPGLAEFVRNLYETYCLAQIDAAPAAILKQLLYLVAANPSILGFINGKEDKPGEHGEISVGQVQALSAKMKAREPLSGEEQKLTRTVLESAPLTWGYWGAIKTAIKTLPIVGNEKSFGVALANISNAPTVGPSRGDASFVSTWGMLDTFGIPSSRTLNYVARRIVRDLRKLAVSNPKSYLDVVKHFALNWQEPYRARSFAAGFIFHGGGVYLNESSRAIDTSLEPGRRSEPFPELWVQSPNVVLEILSSEGKSSKALTMAFQVAEDLRLEIPALKGAQLNFAIKSSYPPLRRLGIDELVNAKSTYEYYDHETWLAVFKEADDEQIAKLIERYRAYDFPASSGSFMAAINQAVLAGAELPGIRLARLAELALRYPFEIVWSNRLPLFQAAVSALGAELFESVPGVLALFNSTQLAQLVQWLDDEDVAFSALSEAIIARSIRVNADFSYGRLSNIAGFVALESNRSLQIAWAVLDADQSDDVALRLLSLDTIQNLSPKFKAQFANELILHTPMALLPDVLRMIQEQSDIWDGFDIIIALGLEAGPGLAWQILALDSLADVQLRIKNSKQLTKAIGDNLQISQMKSASGAQADLAIAYLAEDKLRVKLDPEFVLAAATAANTALSQAGLAVLEANNLVSKYWIRLAESGLPDCLAACSRYLGKIGSTGELTASILALLDSATDSAKKLGLSFLDAPISSLDLDHIWSSLTESEDPEILARVAEESLVRGSIPDDRLAKMDRRILVSRRKSRIAKESVKQRIDFDTFELAPERVRALLELARAQNSRDREWAISRLAILSLNGVAIPSFEAFEVSRGD